MAVGDPHTITASNSRNSLFSTVEAEGMRRDRGSVFISKTCYDDVWGEGGGVGVKLFSTSEEGDVHIIIQYSSAPE